MRPYRSSYSRGVSYEDETIRRFWHGKSPRRQPDGPTLRESGELARRWPVVKPEEESTNP